MNTKSFLVIGIAVSLMGCTPAPDLNAVKPQLTSDKTSIKIGETATLMLTAPLKSIEIGNGVETPINFGFIYSPQSTVGTVVGPYETSIVGIQPTVLKPGAEPSQFPILSFVEITSPITGTENIPEKVVITKEGNLAKATFAIRGKSVGTLKIRGAFTSSYVNFLQYFHRIPISGVYDGEVTIQVVP
jgi:hypothetical protein